jgi:hypothetical protein
MSEHKIIMIVKPGVLTIISKTGFNVKTDEFYVFM